MHATRRALIGLAVAMLTVGAAQILGSQDQPAPQPKPAMQTVQGELGAVDTDAKTITIKPASGPDLTFSYDERTEITGAQSGAAGLATASGSQVTVHFTTEGASRTARKIEVQAKK